SSPTTSTGTRRLTAEPSPSWPRPFSPQHITPLPVLSAHVWRYLAAIASTPPESPSTSPGVSLASSGSLVPRSLPQQASPLSVRAHSLTPPAVTRDSTLVRP